MKSYLTFCEQNKMLRMDLLNFETLIIRPNYNGFNSSYRSKVAGLIYNWNENTFHGVSFLRAGYILNNSVYEFHVGILSKEKMMKQNENKDGFIDTIPDLLVDYLCEDENQNEISEKFKLFADSGTQLRLLISPYEEKTYIFKPNQKTETKLF